jgi:hypothetical protein
MKPPAKWKTAVLIWLAIYPSINLLFFFMGDFLATLHPLLRTLVLTGILVPLMVFVLLPFLQKTFKSWLQQ